MDKSNIPKIKHKYISLFDNEEAYNAAFSEFEEVNWSAIKPSIGPEETPDKYRASRRLSNMYRKNNPPDYKFDNIDDFVLGNKKIVEIQDDGTKKLVIKEINIYADGAYIAKHNTNGNIINDFTPDIIRKTFFLEIVWGIFGWEWHDYNKHEEDIDYTYFTLKHAGYGKYMNLTNEGVIISDTPQVLHSVIENGHTYVTNTDGTYYIGWADNLQDTSCDPNDKVYLELIDYEVEGIKYRLLRTPKGYVGISNYPTSNKCRVDQSTYNNNGIWSIEYKNESPFEVIQGGNLYMIKEIQTVSHIIDGYRLQHINDFLNSQTSVIHVENFDVDTLISINRAFKRINQINGYTLITPCQIDVYDFPLVEEADELFFNNKISIANGHTFNMPLIKQVDSLYAQGAFTEGLKFKMESLIKLTNCFSGAYFNQSVINLNSIFEGTTLSKVTDFEGMFTSAGLYAYTQVDGEDVTTINLDLTGNNVPAGTLINLSKFAMLVGVCGHNIDYNVEDLRPARPTGFVDRRLVINLNFDDNVNLAYGIAGAMKNDKYNVLNLLFGIPNNIWYRNGSFNKLTFNINNKEALIKDLNHFGAYNTFIENLPITSRCNADCNDDGIYQGAICNANITYDFSPTQTISYYYSQFNGAEINTGFTFSNVDCLKSIDFRNTKFPIDTTDSSNPVYTIFPYVLNNPNYTYNQDNSRYQNISFEGSNLGGFAVQDFYLRLGNALSGVERDRKAECEWQLISNSCFKNMPNVDFTANHKLYIETPKLDVIGSVRYDGELFNGCTSMTVTPEIYFSVDLTDFTGTWFYFGTDKWFNNCNSLVEVNMSHVTKLNPRKIIGGDLKFTSPNLVYFRLGNWQGGTISISSKILDIDTFVQTLLNQNLNNGVSGNDRTTLIITNAIYSALQTYDTQHGTDIIGHCTTVFKSFEHREDV